MKTFSARREGRHQPIQASRGRKPDRPTGSARRSSLIVRADIASRPNPAMASASFDAMTHGAIGLEASAGIRKFDIGASRSTSRKTLYSSGFPVYSSGKTQCLDACERDRREGILQPVAGRLASRAPGSWEIRTPCGPAAPKNRRPRR